MPKPKKSSNTKWDHNKQQWLVYCDPLNPVGEAYFYFDPKNIPDDGISEFSKQEKKISDNPTFKKFMERRANDIHGIKKEQLKTQAREGGYRPQALMGLATFFATTISTAINFFKPSGTSSASELFTIYQSSCGGLTSQNNSVQLAQQCLTMAYDFLNKTAIEEKNAATISSDYSKVTLAIGICLSLIILGLFYLNFYSINKEKKEKQYFDMLKDQLKNLPNIKNEIRLKQNVANKILALAGIDRTMRQKQTVIKKISALLLYEKVPGDGHCLFHAVALWIQKSQEDLRNLVANYLEKNSLEFLPFMTLKGKNLGDYIADVRTGKEWADHVEIEVLMRVLNRPILVITPDGTIRNEADSKRFKKSTPIFVYYNNINHYDALLPEKKYSAKKVLSQLKDFVDAPSYFIKLRNLIFEKLDAENDLSTYEIVEETLESIRDIIVNKTDEDLCPIQFLLDLMKCESDIRWVSYLYKKNSIDSFLKQYEILGPKKEYLSAEGVKIFINALLYKYRFLAQYKLSNMLKLKLDIATTIDLMERDFYKLNLAFSKKSYKDNIFSEDNFKTLYVNLENFENDPELKEIIGLLDYKNILVDIEQYHPATIKASI